MRDIEQKSGIIQDPYLLHLDTEPDPGSSRQILQILDPDADLDPRS